jgi:uncharacterized protein
LIAVGGVSGSTKASAIHDLAATVPPVPGARVLRSDVARRRILGIPPTARLPAAAYDAQTTERVYADLASTAEQVVAAGFAAIVDAGFVHPEQRKGIVAAAAVSSVPFVGLWFGAPQDLQGAGAAGAGDWHIIEQDRRGIAKTLATARVLARAAPAVQGYPSAHRRGSQESNAG